MGIIEDYEAGKLKENDPNYRIIKLSREIERLEKENDEVNEEADELQAAMIKYRDEARERETAWSAFKEAVTFVTDEAERDRALKLAPKDE